MSPDTVHQLLHGYRNGHQMLAGSFRLKGDAADLVDRLSDLSGAIIPTAKIDPYLTIYPIPNSGFYGVANTWIDPAGPRSGCVLTHTLLVPVAMWARDPDPSWLAAYLKGPASHQSLDEYKSPISVPINKVVVELPRSSSVSDIERLFIHRFFGEGIRPIVWFDCDVAKENVWSIVRFLWPSMREAFSASTNCLQPRIATDGPFHLMFATSAARPRFNQFPVQAMLRSTNKQAADDPSMSESWVADLARSVFERIPSGRVEAEMATFGPYLEADPTAVRRLFLVSDLKERLTSAPTAGIGLLDAIEALIPSPEAGIEIKSNALSHAYMAARQGAVDESLRSYYLLSDRLRRPAFVNAAADTAASIQKDVHQFIVAHPQIGVTEQKRMSLSGAAALPTSYFNGLLDGLEEIARTRPTDLVALCENDDLAIAAIRCRPAIAEGLLSESIDDPLFASKLLAGWLHTLRDRESRQSLRNQLLPLVHHDAHIPVLSELLTDIEPVEVVWTLKSLFDPTRGFGISSVRRALKEQISERFPEPTREWGGRTSDWSRGAAEIVAETFPASADGVEQLLNHYSIDPHKHVDVWSAFIDRLNPPHLPNWLVRHAENHPEVVAPFLRVAPDMPNRVAQSFERLLDCCSYIPVAREPVVMNRLDYGHDLPCFDLLLSRTMQSVFREFIVGRLDLESHQQYLGLRWANGWLMEYPSAQVVQLATYCENTQEWLRCWSSALVLPDAAYVRSPAILPGIIRGLMRSNVSYWTIDVAHTWQAILGRAAAICDMSTRLRVCADSLRYCFYNKHLPLGPVAAEAFPAVYFAIANNREPPEETSELYSYYDWDKAKTLRKDLIYAFMNSNWSPADLGIAANRSGLTRKVFNRIRRKWTGEAYLNRMLTDLRSRANDESREVANIFEAMMGDPGFYEPWD